MNTRILKYFELCKDIAILTNKVNQIEEKLEKFGAALDELDFDDDVADAICEKTHLLRLRRLKLKLRINELEKELLMFELREETAE